MVLFKFKTTAKKITIIVCNPQRGVSPIKTPRAIDNAFFLAESLLPIKSSTINV